MISNHLRLKNLSYGCGIHAMLIQLESRPVEAKILCVDLFIRFQWVNAVNPLLYSDAEENLKILRELVQYSMQPDFVAGCTVFGSSNPRKYEILNEMIERQIMIRSMNSEIGDVEEIWSTSVCISYWRNIFTFDHISLSDSQYCRNSYQAASHTRQSTL